MESDTDIDFTNQKGPRFSLKDSSIGQHAAGILVALLFLVLIVGVFALGSGNNENKANNKNEVSKENNARIENTIVYGYWLGQEAIVAVHDLSNGESGILTKLPTNVKHVKVTSPKTILYIGETDERDHGKKLIERNLETGSDNIIFTADDNFGIDDYAVSPNGKFVAVWEIQMPANSEVLINGTSRVVNLDRSSSQRYIIYDEVFGVSNPVHYPIGITDSGDLFTDRFLANSGAGWAYGMSKSNLTGSVKSEIPGMENGTYSSQPVMSRDGHYIAFAGFDGIDGKVNKNGFRKALTNPNTVVVYNTLLNSSEIIEVSSDKVQYPLVFWDKNSGNLNYLKSSFKNSIFSDEYISYSPISKTKKSITESLDLGNLYSSLSYKDYLFVVYENASSFLGNLSGKYGQSIKEIASYDSFKKNKQPISMEDKSIQIISINSSNYFSNDLQNKYSNKDQLQLKTFTFKPNLSPKREQQQSNPTPEEPSDPEEPAPLCKDVVTEHCNQLLGTNYVNDDNPANSGQLTDLAFKNCVDRAWNTNFSEIKATCVDSPLYLYGEKGQKITVNIGVPIYSPNIPYSPENGMNVVIDSNGAFYANGKLIEGFSFDYTPGIKKIQRPNYGKVVARQDLENVVSEFAKKQGLNMKETTDLLEEIEKIKSSFQYVSFFDHMTSHKILPLYFTPKTDNYRNIVFYIEEFSEKPNITPTTPFFEPVIRDGLTAVEISVYIR